MMQTCPFLFGYHIKNITEKIEFYRKHNLESLIVNDSRVLFFNLNFIKRRYAFISKKFDISIDNYYLLFLNDKDFLEKFGIMRDELLRGDF